MLRSADFGVLPQNRESLYIAKGFDRRYYGDVDFSSMFSWPTFYRFARDHSQVRQILQSHNEIDDKYTISQRLLDGHIRRKKEHRERGNGFGFSVFSPIDHPYTNTISARYYKDGSEILIDQSDEMQKTPPIKVQRNILETFRANDAYLSAAGLSRRV